MVTASTAAPADRQWFIASRWQEFEGESRANLLRIVAIGAFYIVELVHFYWFEGAAKDLLDFHRQATGVAVAWSMVALGVMFCLRRGVFPAALKYISAGCDVILLTALCSLAEMALSPLVLIYFLIIALGGLRFSLGLVWFSTVASMLGYWLLVGLLDKTWFDADHAVPPVMQLITLLSLAMTGIVIGQVVRRVKALAAHYAERLAALKAKP